MAGPRQPSIEPGVEPPTGSSSQPNKVKPSELHRNTLHEIGLWANKEMGLGQSYKDYKAGKISAGDYIHRHMYVRAVIHKAQKNNRANPSLPIGLADHARLIHKDVLEKQQRAKEAAKKKPAAKKRAK